MNIVFDIILQNNSIQYELIYYLIYAYLLYSKRKQRQEFYIRNNKFNFNYEINMLILDFYFAFVNINDYSIKFGSFKKKINNMFINERIVDLTMLYIFYKHYLKLIDYK
jgi:hypothetical protein